MIQIIADERDIDTVFTDVEWKKIMSFTWHCDTMADLDKGETVNSMDLVDELDEFTSCGDLIQKLAAYALGGEVVRIHKCRTN